MGRLVCFFSRLAALAMIIAGGALGSCPDDAWADFLYAVKITGAVPKQDSDDFEVVVDAAPEVARPSQWEFMGQKAPNDKGPFNARIQGTTNVKTQVKLTYDNGGTAKAGQKYDFGFGLRQDANVKVAVVSADWTVKGKSVQTVPVAGFKVSSIQRDDPLFTLFNDTSTSFELTGVSTLASSPTPLDFSTIEPGFAPGFTSQPGSPILNPGGSASFSAPGGVPGTFAYIQGFITDPSTGANEGAFLFAKAIVPTPEPSTFILLGGGSIGVTAWWVRRRHRTAKPVAGG